MFPPLDFVTHKRDKQLRTYWIHRYKRMGQSYPKLATVGQVELTAIAMPAWVDEYAMRGLLRTERTVWLQRKAATRLMREDESAGGTPRVTWTWYRPCRLCKRILIGLDAEARFHLDRKKGGREMPCSPECGDRPIRKRGRPPKAVAVELHKSDKRTARKGK